MNSPTEKFLLLSSIVIILPARIYVLVWQLWKLPLRNGPGYFLGVEVPPSFHNGSGIQWLRRYHTVLLLEHLAEALFLIAILTMRRWDMIPLTALGAVTFTVTMFGFMLYTRRALGSNPPPRSAVGITLHTRRLGDYISWPTEALVIGIVACSWILLLARGDAQVRWQQVVVYTWVVLGMLPGKIILVRSSLPLPADQAEEHYRLQDAQRHYGLRVFDVFGWFLTAVLLAYALQHTWPAAQAILPLRWLLIAAVFVLGLYMTAVIVRGQGRLMAMGRDLRPAGSWSAPYRGAQWMSRPGLTWFGGIIVLLLILRS
jgi:hypothetical protein